MSATFSNPGVSYQYISSVHIADVTGRNNQKSAKVFWQTFASFRAILFHFTGASSLVSMAARCLYLGSRWRQ